MKKALIHVCCAHCAAYTVEHWRQQEYEASAFWYNPNIHPYAEHQRRLESMKVFAEKTNLPLIVDDSYDFIKYFRRTAGREAQRCRECFNLRLSETAATAREQGFNAFTTTLLISPHQQHEILRETGSQISSEQGIEFLYTDLRQRYSDSRHITKPMDLYRQQYCGCLYSEWERYAETETTK